VRPSAAVECFIQCGGLGPEESLGDGGFRLDGVEGVVGAGHYVQGAGDAGLLQSPGVCDVLVVEQVVGADAGRKTRTDTSASTETAWPSGR
jgi:hypothetical protein